jgi:hypothetical protein
MIRAKKELLHMGIRVGARLLCIVLISCSIAAVAPIGLVGGAWVVSGGGFKQATINVLSGLESSLKNAPEGEMRLCEGSLVEIGESGPCTERLYSFSEVAMAASREMMYFIKVTFWGVLAFLLVNELGKVVFISIRPKIKLPSMGEG